MSDKGMLDRAIGAGATLDWITPSLALISGRPGICVPEGEMVWTKHLLAERGIGVKHGQLLDGLFTFTVASADFDRACAILGVEPRRGKGGALWVWVLVVGAAVAAVVVLMGGL